MSYPLTAAWNFDNPTTSAIDPPCRSTVAERRSTSGRPGPRAIHHDVTIGSAWSALEQP
jgi:hypothetical protein